MVMLGHHSLRDTCLDLRSTQLSIKTFINKIELDSYDNPFGMHLRAFIFLCKITKICYPGVNEACIFAFVHPSLCL